MDRNSDVAHQLRRIEQENGLLFAFKWCGIGLMLALCLVLGSCESMLPQETPRFNRVVGERRVPLMNAELIAAQQARAEQGETAPSPVPLVNAPRQRITAPVVQPVSPVITQAPVIAPPAYAPVPAPMVPPQPIAQPQPEPSMLDQLTGVFRSEPEMPPQPYPTLPPTAATPAFPTPGSNDLMQAEIDALERELTASQAQQAALQPMQAPMLEPIYDPNAMPWQQGAQPPAPAFAPQPMPAPLSAVEPMPSYAPIQARRTPGLLPPPPAPPGVNAAINYAQQPLPESAFPAPAPLAQVAPAPIAAPVIPDAVIANHATAYAAPVPAPQPIPPVAVEVPTPPPVYADPAIARLPSGLIPPDLSAQFEQGYLPPSRYGGRQLRYQ